MWVEPMPSVPLPSRTNSLEHGHATWQHALGSNILTVISVAFVGIPGCTWTLPMPEM